MACVYGMMVTMTYDIERLRRASRSYHRKREAAEAARDELAAEIVAAANAQVAQKDIVAISGYTREAVRQLCLSPEQREAEKEKRKERLRRPVGN